MALNKAALTPTSLTSTSLTSTSLTSTAKATTYQKPVETGVTGVNSDVANVTKSPLVNLAYNKSDGSWNVNALQRIAASENQGDRVIALAKLGEIARSTPPGAGKAIKGTKAPLVRDQRGSAVSALGNLARGDSAAAASAGSRLTALGRRGGANTELAAVRKHGRASTEYSVAKGKYTVSWRKVKSNDPKKPAYVFKAVRTSKPNDHFEKMTIRQALAHIGKVRSELYGSNNPGDREIARLATHVDIARGGTKGVAPEKPRVHVASSGRPLGHLSHKTDG